MRHLTLGLRIRLWRLTFRRMTLPVRARWWRLKMSRGRCVTYVHLYPGFETETETPPVGTRCQCGRTRWGVASKHLTDSSESSNLWA